jgi:F420-dependent oxidoreductase-like protein
MATNTALSFGVKTAPQYLTYQEMLRVWKETDANPAFEHAWLFDHFMPVTMDPAGPVLEGWTLLAALAAQMQRVRVGVMVTSNTFRHPALLAKEAVTVDHISNGRLDFGIGAGWHEMEHNAYGIPLYTPGERLRRLGEACEVILKLWTEPVASFDGTYYQLHDAHFEPKPVQQPHPPIIIGGGGEKVTLRIVAKYADIWNFDGSDVEVYRHKNTILDDYCRALGRDPATLTRSVQYRFNPDNLGEARAALARYIDLGASHFILYLPRQFSADIVARLASEVARPLQEAARD